MTPTGELSDEELACLRRLLGADGVRTLQRAQSPASVRGMATHLLRVETATLASDDLEDID